MSGGAMNYIYYTVEDIGDMVCDAEIGDLFRDLSKLLRAEEWYKSGDTMEKDYREELFQFKNKWFKSDRNTRLKTYIDENLRKLKKDMYDLVGLEIDSLEDNE